MLGVAKLMLTVNPVLKLIFEKNFDEAKSVGSFLEDVSIITVAASRS